MERTDRTISIASGVLSALIVDTLVIGDISFTDAQTWGQEKVNKFVIDVAKRQDKDGKVTDLYSAVKFLEEKYPIPSDPMLNDFGGASHHHLYDFTHHPTPVGWFCAMSAQFGGPVYGTDKTGKLNPLPVSADGLKYVKGDNVSKVWNGTIDWIFHMISDMAGSSGTIKKGGYGTGLPGPILSFLKEVSSNECIRKLVGKAGNTDRDKFSVAVQNLFNGRLLADRDAQGNIIKGTEVPFDLRTEIGLGHELTKQVVPVLINECIVRAFFAISRFIKELERAKVSSIDELSRIRSDAFLPFNNPTLNEMLLTSTTAFTAVDVVAAGVKAAIKNQGFKGGFAKDFLVGINYSGVARLCLAGLSSVVTSDRLEKYYDDFSEMSEKIQNSEVIECITDVPLGLVPATIKVVRDLKESITDYKEAREERIRIQKQCDEQIRILTEYRNDIESEVAGYLVSNITVFDEAFSQMDQAVINNDSDAYIEANSKIQDKLGKESQFNSQDEFDGLMDSDDDFKL